MLLLSLSLSHVFFFLFLWILYFLYLYFILMKFWIILCDYNHIIVLLLSFYFFTYVNGPLISNFLKYILLKFDSVSETFFIMSNID